MNIFNTSIQGVYFVILIIFAPFCTLAVALRFIACRKAGRKLGLEDWFALCALIVYLAFTILSAITLAALNGRNQAVLAVQDPEEFARIRKMTYADLPLFPLQMLFSKLSIMALYLRIFGIRAVYTRWIYFLGAIHISWVIMILVLQTVSCNPLEKFWRPFIPGWCFSEAILAIPSECINSIIDFALVILALFMIQSIHISRDTKWKLGGLFGLGGLYVLGPAMPH
ncbi:hypothetical protein INS49_005050 [Diaporthe citri]|uniref:uncharacterized protein n=1 Tax=Diaporthe citri TaxID=83186 RepID=UPI001C81EE9F|nr:uncharacterized protein INS49_005050 [Diaporthe citri]KAG6354079.1 hypothetical protein INS49_005050 [Diaporthe citri]